MRTRAGHSRAQHAQSNTQRRQVLRWLAAGAGFALLPVAQARRYEDQEFEERISLAGSTLQLNGLGMRAVSIIKGYLAGLYLMAPARTPEAVYSAAGPKRIVMHILLNASTEEFVKAINKGVQRNCSEAEQAALQTQLPPFMAQLRQVGQVRKRDVILMDWLPGSGTQLTVNRKPVGAAVGAGELYTALLKVFLGDRPVDKRLKAGLLGVDAPA